MNKAMQTTKPTNRWRFILNLGFFAGLIWGLVKILLYYLGFTKVIPAFLAEPLFAHDFITSWKGHMIGWLCFIIFSLIAAMIYLVLFGKVKGAWLGIIYGAAWWILLYTIIGPPLKMMKQITKLDGNSIASDLCLFILWGVFIGYTVALEFTDERQREPFTNFDSTQQQ